MSVISSWRRLQSIQNLWRPVTENSKAVTSKHRAVFFDCQKIRGSRPGVFFSACCCALPKKTCFDPGLDMKG